jgi:perosamine synthetase
LQAAVLLPQLDKLDARNALRARNVHLLTQHLQDILGLRPFVHALADTQPGYYKLGFRFDAARFGLRRDRLIAAVRAEGVALDEGFPALHVGRSPSRFHAAGALTEAANAHAGTVILHHPVLLGTASQVEEVASAIAKVYTNADRLDPGIS